ncbi:hypothetical protein HanRHA438_Chr03g0123241 [Helianthus annuus]|uniref:Uncharacterized protein n=1 Tax=Helianthus annuus TaxID=4232 RepID=A0A251SHT9_HELAN|nr:hypothetical protein HanXRQr2_Chr03g0111131 [Helianthus annuus]KAJ0593061.1 hypothetical protein HanHA300_Chr03g0092811 [Helianthus annuus]KAJ0600828.1 hypothetical protein HanIR_Chr03g0121521 [Helianthus annuus]KAJ0608074.1 hypothetical protein HanHA89_Chr03g0104531 [Helianthus annuus]KAJ0768139.1 hypothetical protein HanLR1_Chr03g0097901 [Helianthus annuus]
MERWTVKHPSNPTKNQFTLSQSHFSRSLSRTLASSIALQLNDEEPEMKNK